MQRLIKGHFKCKTSTNINKLLGVAAVCGMTLVTFVSRYNIDNKAMIRAQAKCINPAISIG
jgi:hypothetical protein